MTILDALKYAVFFMVLLFGTVACVSLVVAKVLSWFGIDSFCAYFFWVALILSTLGLAVVFFVSAL
jgi:hypothetical protein